MVTTTSDHVINKSIVINPQATQPNVDIINKSIVINPQATQPNVDIINKSIVINPQATQPIEGRFGRERHREDNHDTHSH